MADRIIQTETLTGIANAIRSKTGSSANISVADFPSEIANIPTGGGEPVTPSDVNFYDYDGSLVYAYSAQDFASLTEMPTNPTHTGLIAQGWNWSLSTAKAYVATYGKLHMGQMYTTDDGKTRIYIKLESGRLSPYLGIAVNGTAVIDWGDGTTDTVTGTSTSTIINTQHIYPSAEKYIISVDVITGTMAIRGDNTNGSKLMWKNSTGVQNRVYQNAIQRIEIGDNCIIGDTGLFGCHSLKSITLPNSITSIGWGAFQNCFNLTSITIPNSITSIANGIFWCCYSLVSAMIPHGVTSMAQSVFYACHSLVNVTIPDSVATMGNEVFSACRALEKVIIPDGVTVIPIQLFYGCYSLEEVVLGSGVTSIGNNAFNACNALARIIIPDTVTTIGNGAFGYCYSLPNITIPNSITSIGSSAFTDCTSLGYIKFTNTTPPTVGASNAWTNVPTDCVIYVPTGSLTAYTTATNYPSSSAYTYVEY